MVIYRYDKAGNFWHLNVLIKLCITKVWVLSFWPKSSLYLADCKTMCLHIQNPETANTADWDLCWCNLVQRYYSQHRRARGQQLKRDTELARGGRQESSQTRTQAFCCESLGHHKHASWVVGCYGNLKTTGNDPHCSAIVLHGLLPIIGMDANHHAIGWHELLETSARVLPLCLRISNTEFMKLQKTKLT